MKIRVESERKKARNESRRRAEECIKNGEISKANRKFNEAVEIDSMMIYKLCSVLKSIDV
jgi:exonuclease-1